MKKVLILSGSPRKGGNSDTLCNEFKRGAQASGNSVTKINVCDKNIGYCLGCYYCAEHNGTCVFNDDMAELLQQIIDADVIILSSPVYFYSINAQLKTVIDRTVARWLEVHDKEFYYIATAGEDDPQAVERTIACFRGYADCVENAKEMGVIRAYGVNDKGDIDSRKDLLEQAYNMGLNV